MYGDQDSSGFFSCSKTMGQAKKTSVNAENMELGRKGKGTRGVAVSGLSLPWTFITSQLFVCGCGLQILMEFVFVFQAQLEGIIAPKK